MKKNALILSILIGLFTTVGAKEIAAYHSWTALMLKTFSYEDFSHAAYFESWNDTEDGQILWLLSNKFGYKLNSNLKFAVNHTILDIQAGNKKNSSAPHQHRFELEATNSFEYLTKMSVRYRFENRVKPDISGDDAWDFRLRIKPSIKIPVFSKESGLGMFTEAEFLFNNLEAGRVFNSPKESFNESRINILGLTYKANDNMSFKMAPGLRYKYGKGEWGATGTLYVLLINKF